MIRRAMSSDDVEEGFYGYALEGELAQKVRAQREVEEYGFLGEHLVNQVFQLMEKDRAFEIPERVIEQTAVEKDLREKLLQPKAYREHKLPSMSAFMGDAGARFEKPLFDQYLKLRKFLFPVTAMCCLLEEEEMSQEQFSLLGAIVNALRKEMVDELRGLHLQRMAAKIPDAEARAILLADKNSVFHSESAQSALKQARAIKKANESFQPKKMPTGWKNFKRRPAQETPPSKDTRGEASSSSSPSSSSSSSSTPRDSNQGTQQAPPAKGRGGPRGRGKRGRG